MYNKSAERDQYIRACKNLSSTLKIFRPFILMSSRDQFEYYLSLAWPLIIVKPLQTVLLSICLDKMLVRKDS